MARRRAKTRKTTAVTWAAMFGSWAFDDRKATFHGPTDPNAPVGLALSSLRFREGTITTRISLPTAHAQARVVFGFDPEKASQFSAGIGGPNFAYYVDELIPRSGGRPLASIGPPENLEARRPYAVRLVLRGQSFELSVDDVPVAALDLPRPPDGEQVGLLAMLSGGREEGVVTFEDLMVESTRPRAFVVMQYGEPFDDLYSEVIRPVTEEMGLEAYRADEVYQPGLIIQDIVTGLIDSAVVVAEISPENPNVFYELGYAHALEKPTILLARRGRDLPFDVSPYRCIFYDDTIGGKRDVERLLRQHLDSILGRPLT